MQTPTISVYTKRAPVTPDVYEKLPGDTYIHALLGKHGELRIHSSKQNPDAEIESKNLPKEVYTVIAVYNATEWESYHSSTDAKVEDTPE